MKMMDVKPQQLGKEYFKIIKILALMPVYSSYMYIVLTAKLLCWDYAEIVKINNCY